MVFHPRSYDQLTICHKSFKFPRSWLSHKADLLQLSPRHRGSYRRLHACRRHFAEAQAPEESKSDGGVLVTTRVPHDASKGRRLALPLEDTGCQISCQQADASVVNPPHLQNEKTMTEHIVGKYEDRHNIDVKIGCRELVCQ